MLSWLQNGDSNFVFKPLFVFNQFFLQLSKRECFDRRRSHDDISNCVENCSVPFVRSQQMVENEMARFQVSYFSFFFFVIPIPIFIQFLPGKFSV
jgi:hypothetical protein